jgi:hypothetical protein
MPACSGRDIVPALVGTHEGCPYKRLAESHSADVGPNSVRPRTSAAGPYKRGAARARRDVARPSRPCAGTGGTPALRPHPPAPSWVPHAREDPARFKIPDSKFKT